MASTQILALPLIAKETILCSCSSKTFSIGDRILDETQSHRLPESLKAQTLIIRQGRAKGNKILHVKEIENYDISAESNSCGGN